MTDPTPSSDDPVLSAISARLGSIDEKLTSAATIQDRTAAQIEANTQQLALLAEGLTRLENTVNNGFERLERNLDRQYEITQMQGQHIDRLIALLEQRNAE